MYCSTWKCIGDKALVYHCNSIKDLVYSLEGMIKNPSQYSLADLRINLRISIHVYGIYFKEEGLMNILLIFKKT